MRNATWEEAAYAGSEPAGIPVRSLLGVRIVQTAHPRDVAALALVVGMLLVLFIVAVLLGTPVR